VSIGIPGRICPDETKTLALRISLYFFSIDTAKTATQQNINQKNKGKKKAAQKHERPFLLNG